MSDPHNHASPAPSNAPLSAIGSLRQAIATHGPAIHAACAALAASTAQLAELMPRTPGAPVGEPSPH